MRIITLLLAIFWIIISGILSVYVFSFVNYVNGKAPIYNDVKVFKKLKSTLEWKNYLQRNNKIYIVSNYIITPKTKISGVVEINWENKKFSNLTLDKLKQYNNIGKIYITQVWGITLNWSIILQWYKWWTLIHWDVVEKNKWDKNSKNSKNSK